MHALISPRIECFLLESYQGIPGYGGSVQFGSVGHASLINSFGAYTE
jgi:hypothetical protein